jgi:hypothetical protein
MTNRSPPETEDSGVHRKPPALPGKHRSGNATSPGPPGKHRSRRTTDEVKGWLAALAPYVSLIVLALRHSR